MKIFSPSFFCQIDFFAELPNFNPLNFRRWQYNIKVYIHTRIYVWYYHQRYDVRKNCILIIHNLLLISPASISCCNNKYNNSSMLCTYVHTCNIQISIIFSITATIISSKASNYKGQLFISKCQVISSCYFNFFNPVAMDNQP